MWRSSCGYGHLGSGGSWETEAGWYPLKDNFTPWFICAHDCFFPLLDGVIVDCVHSSVRQVLSKCVDRIVLLFNMLSTIGNILCLL